MDTEKRFHEKFYKTKCSCGVLDDIARVAVNFAILFLETHQIVPLSQTDAGFDCNGTDTRDPYVPAEWNAP